MLSRNCPLRVYTNPEDIAWLASSQSAPVFRSQNWGSDVNFNYWETSPRLYPKITCGTPVRGGFANYLNIEGKVKPEIHATMIVAGSGGMRSEVIVGWPQHASAVRYVGPAEHAEDDTRAISSMHGEIAADEASLGTGEFFASCLQGSDNEPTYYTVLVFANRAAKNRIYAFCQYKPVNTADNIAVNQVLSARDYETPDVMFEFGSAQDDTVAIEIRDINNDYYFDIVEANSMGVSRIYYGTEESSRTMDIGSLPTSRIRQIGTPASSSVRPPQIVGLGIAPLANDLDIFQAEEGGSKTCLWTSDTRVDVEVPVHCAAHRHSNTWNLFAALPRGRTHGARQRAFSATGRLATRRCASVGPFEQLGFDHPPPPPPLSPGRTRRR